MERRTSLLVSTRSTPLERSAGEVWAAVVAAGGRGRWYTEAAPLVVRGTIDRLLGGRVRRWPVPVHEHLESGDRAGFWEVREVDDDARLLRLAAAVRAPGEVELTAAVLPHLEGCALRQTVSFRPRGPVGAAYLLADLPARELVVELVHRSTLAEVSRARPPVR